MQPKIIESEEKHIVGMRLRIKPGEERTAELWRGFMPRRAEIAQRSSSDYISMHIFENPGRPEMVIEKWAAVEVRDAGTVPEAMESFTIPAGTYLVFMHHGPASTFMKTLRFITDTWLPASGYEEDDRPQFEILSEEYRPDDPAAAEQVWLPVRKRA